MTLEEALKIIDPDTCHDALAVYAGDCDMLHAKAVEASRMVVDAYKTVEKDRDAAVLTIQAMFDCDKEGCLCGFCTRSCATDGGCRPKWNRSMVVKT